MSLRLASSYLELTLILNLNRQDKLSPQSSSSKTMNRVLSGKFRRERERLVKNNPNVGKNHYFSYLETHQCDQIGPFLKDPGCKFSLKSSANIWWLLGYFEKWHYSMLNLCVFFGRLLKKLGFFTFQHLVTLPTTF